MIQPRYDEQRGIYRDCKWCQGRGCIYCKSEADKAYKAAFPDGPQPLATFSLDEIDGARAAIGMEALQKAFGPGGGGISEVMANIAKAKGEAAPPANENDSLDDVDRAIAAVAAEIEGRP